MRAAAPSLLAILCVCCMPLCTPVNGSDAVEWRNVGDSITIKCTISSKPAEQTFLHVKKGLKKSKSVLTKMKHRAPPTISQMWKERIQWAGEVPAVSVLISNLTQADTGLYRCEFEDDNINVEEGDGSVMLVVTDTVSSKECQSSRDDQKPMSSVTLLLLSLIISSMVLLSFCIVLSVWMKKKISHGTKKQRRGGSNDVYEDMRATIRR